MGNKKNELLALDLDGTTLRDNNTLSPVVRQAIETAVQNGVEVVAASGRPYAMMPQSILSIKGIDYAVTSNGAAVNDCSGKRIHSNLLKEDEVLKYLEITANYDLVMEAFIDGKTYTDKRYFDDPIKYGCGEAYFDYVRAAHGSVENMRKFIYDHRCELDSIEFVCVDKKMRELIRRQIEDNTTNFYVTSSSENFVEIMDSNASKSNALSWLCQRLGISLQNTSACGNADNDADMLKLSGLGAAVKNATELCKINADIIVPSNNDDGVANLIGRILKNRT